MAPSPPPSPAPSNPSAHACTSALSRPPPPPSSAAPARPAAANNHDTMMTPHPVRERDRRGAWRAALHPSVLPRAGPSRRRPRRRVAPLPPARVQAGSARRGRGEIETRPPALRTAAAVAAAAVAAAAHGGRAAARIKVSTHMKRQKLARGLGGRGRAAAPPGPQQTAVSTASAGGTGLVCLLSSS